MPHSLRQTYGLFFAWLEIGLKTFSQVKRRAAWWHTPNQAAGGGGRSCLGITAAADLHCGKATNSLPYSMIVSNGMMGPYDDAEGGSGTCSRRQAFGAAPPQNISPRTLSDLKTAFCFQGKFLNCARFGFIILNWFEHVVIQPTRLCG